MYYTDYTTWPASDGQNWTNSLDRYTDRSMDSSAFTKIEIKELTDGRVLIGLTAAGGSPLSQTKVQAKLVDQAKNSALFSAAGGAYSGGGTVYMPMR